MTFLSPLFFWSLLALIPLALVYFMKARPRKRVTNALFLWQQVLKESATQVWLRKIRNLLSLILLAAVFILACLSLTNPKFGSESDKDLVIILDNSVSMRAKDGSKSRFENAKGEIQSVLRSVEGGSRVAFASVADTLTYHSHLSNNTQGIKDSIKELEASQYPLNANLLKGFSMLENEGVDSDVKVLFFTDGRSQLTDLPDLIETVVIGESSDDNIGLSAGDINSFPDGSAKLFFTINSASETQEEVELELTHTDTGRVGKFLTLTLAPHETKSEIISIDSAEAGSWALTILREDSLAEDNVLFLGLNIPKPIAVGVDTTRGYFYKRCIQAFQTAENLLTLTESSKADFIISENALPSTSKNSLVFSPEGESDYFVKVGQSLPSVIPEAVIKGHPLLNHLKLELFSFAGARELVAPEGSTIVVEEVGGTPLIYSYEQEGREVVVINLDPAAENFYLSPTFPVLVHNAARYLANREEEFPAVMQIGRKVSLPLAESGLTQTFNHGEQSMVTPLTSNVVSLNAIGSYKFSNAHETLTTGVGVLSAHESGPVTLNPEASQELSTPTGWPLAWYLLLVAAVIVLVEDALYQRRRVG